MQGRMGYHTGRIYTRDELECLSTVRLLKVFKAQRDQWRPPFTYCDQRCCEFPCPHEEEHRHHQKMYDEYMELFKSILNTREHVPRPAKSKNHA